MSLRGTRRGGSSLGRRSRRLGGGRTRATRNVESRSDITPADVGEDDMGGGVLLLDQVRVPLGAAARAGVPAIEPIHVAAGVVPDAEDEDHAAAQCLAHGGQSAKGGCRAVDGGAPVLRDGADARRGHSVGDHLAVLDVLSADLGQGAGGGAVVGDKLRGDGKGLRGVDCVAGAPVVRLALSVWVEAAAASVAVRRAAGVRGVRVSAGVGLEDVHLVAAVACAAGVEGAVPPGHHRALRVTVARAILGASSVVFVATTGGAHLGEVQGAVFAAGECGQVHIEGDLLS